MKDIRRLAAATFILVMSVNSYSRPITAVLRLKEKVRIEDLAANVLSPVSLHYQKPFSPEELKRISAPSEKDYQNLISNLKSNGFKIMSESKTHLWISVRADQSLFENVFSTRIQKLSKNKYRNLLDVKIPNDLSQVANVSGLDNTRKAFPKFIVAKASSDQPQGVSQSAIKSAYAFDAIYQSGITGKGQHIAIATYDGFNIDDVTYFYNASKLNPSPSVDQVKFNGDAVYSENSAMETQLDAEFAGMIAPGASVHVFASATNDDAGELQLFTSILDDNRAKVVNYSWGSCEPLVTPSHRDEMAKVFARAVAQGVNILVASGDSGSDSCQDGTNRADWPAANPDVVAVGGTTLAIASDTSVTETAWNGSGGGISGVWDLPSYQNALGAPYLKRSYPDVAFNADPASGQAIWAHLYGRATWVVIGGTSMAAPQWSGFLALVAESRAQRTKQTLGFLNPIIYSLSNLERANLFRDIIEGANGTYKAGPGWDAVTGFGSMRADVFLEKLTGI